MRLTDRAIPIACTFRNGHSRRDGKNAPFAQRRLPSNTAVMATPTANHFQLS